MDIHINKDSEISVHDQIARQLVFLIGTGRLKPGTLLPSVRALAHRLGVHRNTISRAFRDPILNKLVEKRTGRQLAVRALQPDSLAGWQDLDDLLDVAIKQARGRGFSVRQLYERLEERMAAAPPQRLLVISDDPGMRDVLPTELKAHFDYRVDTCSPGDLLSKPELAAGALVISPQGHIPQIRPALPRERPVVPITYSSADPHLESMGRLTTPSVIAVVSVSAYFIQMACGVLQTIDGGHTTQSYLLKNPRAKWDRSADVVVCDAISCDAVQSSGKPRIVLTYKLISDDCIDVIAAAMDRSTPVAAPRPRRAAAKRRSSLAD